MYDKHNQSRAHGVQGVLLEMNTKHRDLIQSFSPSHLSGYEITPLIQSDQTVLSLLIKTPEPN